MLKALDMYDRTGVATLPLLRVQAFPEGVDLFSKLIPLHGQAFEAVDGLQHSFLQ